jgi:hypothetical protein
MQGTVVLVPSSSRRARRSAGIRFKQRAACRGSSDGDLHGDGRVAALNYFTIPV